MVYDVRRSVTMSAAIRGTHLRATFLAELFDTDLFPAVQLPEKTTYLENLAEYDLLPMPDWLRILLW